MARARGGRGEGRARPDGLGSRAARDPRRRAPRGRFRPARRADRTARRCGDRLGPPPGWARAPRRRRRARRCWRTAWPEGATHRSSSGCACSEASGTALDHLRMHGAERSALPSHFQVQPGSGPAGGELTTEGSDRHAGDVDPRALPRSPRRRPGQGSTDRAVRRRHREGSVLLRGGDGHRPAPHARGRRRRGLSGLHRPSRHVDHDDAALGARGGELPGESRAGRGGSAHPGPARDRAPGRGGPEGDRFRPDRRSRARVLPGPARSGRNTRHPAPRRPAEHGLHGRASGGPRRHRAGDDRGAGAASGWRSSPSTTSS